MFEFCFGFFKFGGLIGQPLFRSGDLLRRPWLLLIPLGIYSFGGLACGLLAVVWGAALLYLVGDRLLPVRQNQVVQQQSADHVDAQPPSVGAGGQQGAGSGEPDLER